MTDTWNTPSRATLIPRSSLFRHSTNGAQKLQYTAQDQHNEPMINLRAQNIRTPSRNSVIAGTRKRPISSTPQDARVARFAPPVHQPRMN